nr:hypothetical protein L204_04270 [Cryptococcus depauperatus CBS 7855]
MSQCFQSFCGLSKHHPIDPLPPLPPLRQVFPGTIGISDGPRNGLNSTFVHLQMPLDGHLDPDTYEKITSAKQNVDLVLSHMRLLINNGMRREKQHIGEPTQSQIYNCIRNYSEQILTQWFVTYSGYTTALRQIQKADCSAFQEQHLHLRATSEPQTISRSWCKNSLRHEMGLSSIPHDNGLSGVRDSTHQSNWDQFSHQEPSAVLHRHSALFGQQSQAPESSDKPPPVPDKPSQFIHSPSSQLPTELSFNIPDTTRNESITARPATWQAMPEMNGALLKAVKRLSQTQGGFTGDYLRVLERVSKQDQDSAFTHNSSIVQDTLTSVPHNDPRNSIGLTHTPSSPHTNGPVAQSQQSKTIPRIRPPSQAIFASPLIGTTDDVESNGISFATEALKEDFGNKDSDKGRHARKSENVPLQLNEEMKGSPISGSIKKSPSTSTFGPQELYTTSKPHPTPKDLPQTSHDYKLYSQCISKTPFPIIPLNDTSPLTLGPDAIGKPNHILTISDHPSTQNPICREILEDIPKLTPKTPIETQTSKTAQQRKSSSNLDSVNPADIRYKNASVQELQAPLQHQHERIDETLYFSNRNKHSPFSSENTVYSHIKSSSASDLVQEQEKQKLPCKLITSLPEIPPTSPIHLSPSTSCPFFNPKPTFNLVHNTDNEISKSDSNSEFVDHFFTEKTASMASMVTNRDGSRGRLNASAAFFTPDGSPLQRTDQRNYAVIDDLKDN